MEAVDISASNTPVLPKLHSCEAVTESSNEKQIPLHLLTLGDGNFSFSLGIASFLWSFERYSKRTTITEITESSWPVSHIEKENNHGEVAAIEKCSSAVASHPFWHLLPTRHKSVSVDTIQLTCSSFDSQEEVLSKYPESRGIFEWLDSYKQVHRQHGVNAWELQDVFGSNLFDAIIWNHPHLGIENMRLHRFLMAHFFYSSSLVLKEDGRISVSLVEGQAERWTLVEQAERQGLHLLEKHPMKMEAWPGYEAKRNRNGRSFKNLHTQRHTLQEMKSWIYIFVKNEQTQVNFLSTEDSGVEQQQTSKLFKTPLSMPHSSMTESESPLGISLLSTENNACTTSVPLSNLSSNISPMSSSSKSILSLDSPFASSPTGASSPSLTSAVVSIFPYQCDVCGKQFQSKQGLFTHTRQVHIYMKYGESWHPHPLKTHACTVCARIFQDKNA
ncbi:putative UPF0617 protein, partial [Cardiosporidium cionae]